jgi:hypothetical protein
MEDVTGRACSTHGREKEAYRILMRKLEGKRPLGRHDEGGRIILKWFLDK